MHLKTVHAAAALSSGTLEAAAMQELLEKVPELRVEDGVDDGVQSAVDVAEPRHHAHQGRGDVAVLTASSHRVQDKERSPAEQEGTCTRKRRKISQKFSSDRNTSNTSVGLTRSPENSFEMQDMRTQSTPSSLF